MHVSAIFFVQGNSIDSYLIFLYIQGRNRQYRQGLYQTLLKAYLRPKDESHKTLIRPALELLNAHGADFDAAEV